MTLTRSAVAMIVSLALLTMVAGCSGSTGNPAAPPITSTVFAGSVSDSTGDTIIQPVLRNGVLMTPVVPVPPDLILASLVVSGGSLTATLSLAPGTLSHADTFLCVFLDVDENPLTGNPSAGGDVALGFDYSICSVLPRGSTNAQISQLGGGTAVGTNAVPVTFVSPDQVRFTVPLAQLGNDDGRMAYKVNAMQWVDAPILNTSAIDWMPDLGRAAGLLR